MSEVLTASRAKELLAPIPHDEWAKGVFLTKDCDDEYPSEDALASSGKYKCCAIGHLMRLTSKNPDEYSFENCQDFVGDGRNEFRQMTMKAIKKLHGIHASIADVNNTSLVNGYTEPQIKDRVLHFLDDLIAAGY